MSIGSTDGAGDLAASVIIAYWLFTVAATSALLMICNSFRLRLSW
jgi:hypothetical protein